MCLFTRQIKSIITKKDMIVVKRLTVEENYSMRTFTYFSHYYYIRFKYIPEVLNTTELGITRGKPKDIASFGNIDSTYYKEGPLRNRKLTIIERGFHFMIEESPSYIDSAKYDDQYIFKFLIPKGSQIFLGKTGLGVSNQIIMLKP